MSNGFIPGLVIETGPMYSEKTLALIRHLERYRHALDHVQAFYPAKDERTAVGSIQTRWHGVAIPADPVNRASDILKLLHHNTRVVGIDEIQFLPDADEVVTVIVHELIRRRRLRVVVAGLNLDYKGNPFAAVRALMPYAEQVTVNPAVCTVPTEDGKCGHPAYFSQLFIEGGLAPVVGEQAIVQKSPKENYQPRCALHYTIL